jgi:hypothetical protein
MKTAPKYSPEFRELAVRMVFATYITWDVRMAICLNAPGPLDNILCL